MRLLEWVRSLGSDTAYLSRIRIEPGPGRCLVTGSIARYDRADDVGVLEDGSTAPILRRPVSADDEAGRRAQRPPITMQVHDRAPDAEAEIDTLDLQGQMVELESAGVVGGLNVERLGRGWIISTHAATQAERTAWVISLSGR